MAATGDSFGLFWNSINKDRTYNGDSFERWAKTFFTNGVFNGHLQVLSQSGMNVTVKTGYAHVEGKPNLFEGDATFTIAPANSRYPRIDTIVVRRDNENRSITREYVQGAYSGNTPIPTAPTRDGIVYELVLAQIYVAAGATDISQSNITDTRMDVDLCGWVVGTVKEVSFEQIKAQFNQFELESRTEFESWENYVKSNFETWQNSTESNFETWQGNVEGDFESWLSNQQDAFIDWFNGLQVQLDEDVATNHERRITALEAGGATKVETILEAAMWQNGEYSFEAIYPASQYDLQVDLNGDIATATEARVYAAAHIAGSVSANKIFAFGNIPERDIPVVLTVNMRDETYRANVMVSTDWNNNKYSFESDYPIAQYDISIEPDGARLNESIIEAWSKALIFGQVTENKAVAYGDVPEIDIPIIVKVVKK